ncbi:MAG TPA: outer membrane lipoprotein chaperone LolA [Gammaproteobacteria bacterium]|nr:outer membrane lipoprotein chaperone LolA [Gammaproteobacteria bacterium]
MRFFLKLFFAMISILFFQLAHANPASDELTALLNNIHTLQANFHEMVKDTKGKTLTQSDGKMSLRRPGQFRWDVMQPNRQLIVTNGQTIWIYDADLQQVTIRRLQKEAGEVPALLLSNTNETLTKDFSVEKSGDGKTQWFLLKPKDKSSLFEEIKLGFDNQQITTMQLQDHLGHVTMIQFSHGVANRQLSAALFAFKAPAGVDVIDEIKK